MEGCYESHIDPDEHPKLDSRKPVGTFIAALQLKTTSPDRSVKIFVLNTKIL